MLDVSTRLRRDCSRALRGEIKGNASRFGGRQVAAPTGQPVAVSRWLLAFSLIDSDLRIVIFTLLFSPQIGKPDLRGLF